MYQARQFLKLNASFSRSLQVKVKVKVKVKGEELATCLLMPICLLLRAHVHP